MSSRRFGSERGTILVVLLILVIVAAMVGVWALYSSQSGITKAGHFRGATSLTYQAEEGLQKALARILAIADPSQTDPLFSQGLYSAPEKNMDWLVSIMEQGNADIPNAPCPEPFDPDVGLNDVLETDPGPTNVICNFMGAALKNTQVVLVRQPDFTENSQLYEIFLANSVARDAVGRKQVVQGVIVVPYFCNNITGAPYSDCSMPTGQKPYVATVVQRSAD